MHINRHSLKIHVHEHYEYMAVTVVMYVVNEFILKIHVYQLNEYTAVVIVHNESMNWIKGRRSLLTHTAWRGVGPDIIHTDNVGFPE